MTEFTHKYTATEIETIAKNAMLAANFSLIKRERDLVNNEDGIFARDQGESIVDICSVYQKTEDNNTRRIVLFPAARDFDFRLIENNKDEVGQISTFAGLLSRYSRLNIQADELIFPIALSRNLGVIHWNLLHIKKDADTYHAAWYEPENQSSTNSKKGISYIKKLIRDYFNCYCIPTPTKQINSNAQANIILGNLSGLSTVENIFSVVENVPLKPNIEHSLDELKHKHELFYNEPVKDYGSRPITPDNAPWETDAAIEPTKDSEPFSTTSSFSSMPLSASSSSLGSEQSTPNNGNNLSFTSASDNNAHTQAKLGTFTIDAGENAPLSLLFQGTTDTTNTVQNRDSATPTDKKIEQMQAKAENSEAYQLLIDIQNEIINKQDTWGTKLGGNNVYYFKRDKNTKKIKNISDLYSVPDGVKLILNEIRKAHQCINNKIIPDQSAKELACKEAFLAIKKIARERLDKPRFSCWFFNVRSDTTTNFYKDILSKYDPAEKIQASLQKQEKSRRTNFCHI